MLRDHVLFQKPLPIDIKKTTAVDTPEAFRDEIKSAKIEVLPLARDTKGRLAPGWCTYTYEHDGAPELEVICGGINSKTPKAGAVWRQGSLLHFGFDLAPAEMNDTGRALLVNAVAYIARFPDDRPIVHTPCVFVQGKRLVDRDYLARRLRQPKPDLSGLPYFFAKGDFEKHLKDKSLEEVSSWYKRERDYLRADADGKLAVDAQARDFGVPPAGSEFLVKASAALGGPRAADARRLLVRYAPDGPGDNGSAADWATWVEKNRDYVFFSDTGGYRWYLDSLAQRRGVPTAELRGPVRATR
ncbi:MAG TPA: hypothetical protein VKD71_06625 [Gemmataceae bacterium]|nr:hypothetical protein [Gemmataceae bacterium]